MSTVDDQEQALQEAMERANRAATVLAEDIETEESQALVTLENLRGKATTPHHPQRSEASKWPILDEAAFHGIIGKFTKAIAAYSEADPVGILLHSLIGCGAMIGTKPHVLVERTPHFARLFTLLIGRTAGGRKGTSWGPPKYLLSQVDGSWVTTRVKSGLSSGEGLIYHVRDPSWKKVPIKDKHRHTGEFEEVLVDQGEDDKRLLIIESEFACPLKCMEREGNTLSPILRDAWDHGNMSPLTKNSQISATGAHVSVIGHITVDELRRYLTVTELSNGFANRFLFALVKRAQFLPSGKGAPDSVYEEYFTPLMRILSIAQERTVIARDPECEELWADSYQKLEEEIPGLTGSILARGAAQVLRLSLQYALLDPEEVNKATTAIRVPHLLAALAVWDYCKASTFHIFGDAIGDPVADRLLRAIKMVPQTDTDLYNLLGKHGRDATRKEQALDLLMQYQKVHPVKILTEGRPVHEWHHGTLTECALCAKRG